MELKQVRENIEGVTLKHLQGKHNQKLHGNRGMQSRSGDASSSGLVSSFNFNIEHAKNFFNDAVKELDKHKKGEASTTHDAEKSLKTMRTYLAKAASDYGKALADKKHGFDAWNKNRGSQGIKAMNKALEGTGIKLKKATAMNDSQGRFRQFSVQWDISGLMKGIEE